MLLNLPVEVYPDLLCGRKTVRATLLQFCPANVNLALIMLQDGHIKTENIMYLRIIEPADPVKPSQNATDNAGDTKYAEGCIYNTPEVGGWSKAHIQHPDYAGDAPLGHAESGSDLETKF